MHVGHVRKLHHKTNPNEKYIKIVVINQLSSQTLNSSKKIFFLPTIFFLNPRKFIPFVKELETRKILPFFARCSFDCFKNSLIISLPFFPPVVTTREFFGSLES